VLFVADRAAAGEHERRLAPMRAKLKAARDQRKQPRWIKVITSWNALMHSIAGVWAAGAGLSRATLDAAGARPADGLLQHHRTPDGGCIG